MGHVNSTKNCEECGNELIGKRPTQKYCSMGCSGKSIGKRKLEKIPLFSNITCGHCQIGFSISNYLSDGITRRYEFPRHCSKQCKLEAKRIARDSKAPPQERQCGKCKAVLPFTSKHFGKNKSRLFGLDTQCRSCLVNYAKKKGRSYMRRVRQQVLTVYGNGRMSCVCCGESNYESTTSTEEAAKIERKMVVAWRCTFDSGDKDFQKATIEPYAQIAITRTEDTVIVRIGYHSP